MDNNKLKLENQICFKIYSAEREITKLYRNLLEELDVTYPQYLVMLVLWEEKSVTVKELGQKLFLDSGTLSPMLKRMEGNGLIERRRSLEDERTVIISLTKKGEDLKGKAQCIPTKLLENLSLDLVELNNLNQTLSTILNRIQQINS
ncbi:MarR family transcriptional regulator [Bacillus sp. ISL-40]|uniref:MarR family transcriptional regulator n=1 Tax=Priestia megaterium TaxID=1404 RepID=A0A6H1NW32_PRIMG|nr:MULTISPECIES: MarR family transcriptional regulator [Bacillaceae]MBT2695904.1 MarR family transcriptional regulator [Bacillus sp. ISL-40]MBT2739740.1 MarR family transcriptional regulator [Bacillus sp. ISL-77]QIZ05489.1 MarR family transcriptional regulator [Priestia megaterium]